MNFSKFHAIGNDYIVISPLKESNSLSPEEIRRICHRNFGVGSDGILFGPELGPAGEFRLRIFNPDGSEAEKSGNGLRIFARYLWEQALVSDEPFKVITPGGAVSCQVFLAGREVLVEMGRVSFSSSDIPVLGAPREVLNEEITVLGKTFRYNAATVGNPHCVIFVNEVSAEEAKKYGPAIEVEARFPRRTNVQFVQVIDRGNIRLEIWERGAGYTLASGSSSCAAAAVSRRLGLVDEEMTVHMPGGKLSIHVSELFDISMRGSVTKVGEGSISTEIFDAM